MQNCQFENTYVNLTYLIASFSLAFTCLEEEEEEKEEEEKEVEEGGEAWVGDDREIGHPLT